jgi:hypothetical protein
LFLDLQCTEDWPSNSASRTFRALAVPRPSLRVTCLKGFPGCRRPMRLSCFGCRGVWADFERFRARRRVSVYAGLRYVCHRVTYKIRIGKLPCCLRGCGRWKHSCCC